MSLSNIFLGADISASGMAAERLRMEVVANNLANAHSTRSPDGGPYRRKQVVFQEVMKNQSGVSFGGPDNAHQFAGVKVVGVKDDQTPLPEVYQPGHPDADEDGFVRLTNVKPAFEMLDLITASRSYEANLRALRTFREMAEQAIGLLRGA